MSPTTLVLSHAATPGERHARRYRRLLDRLQYGLPFTVMLAGLFACVSLLSFIVPAHRALGLGMAVAALLALAIALTCRQILYVIERPLMSLAPGELADLWDAVTETPRSREVLADWVQRGKHIRRCDAEHLRHLMAIERDQQLRTAVISGDPSSTTPP